MTESKQDTGELQDLPIHRLLLDPANPRLPQEAFGESPTQRDLAIYINAEFNPLKIAESIANHEFFRSEPLIAVPHKGKFRVIEGNRRLTALLGLTDKELLNEFAKENRGWRKLASAKPPSSVPVLVVTDRRAMAPLLGYRHISGIEPWDPYAQSAFIASLVQDGSSLAEVAEVVGRSTTDVNSMYRDHEILRQAKEQFGLDIGPAKASFGVFGAAMGRQVIREYIGAPPPRMVSKTTPPMPDEAEEYVGELLILLFGDAEGNGRVIHDSRQLANLVRVLADESGRGMDVLRETADLAEAVDALDEPNQQIIKYLRTAERNLAKAVSGAGSLKLEDVEYLLESIERNVAKLRATILPGRAE